MGVKMKKLLPLILLLTSQFAREYIAVTAYDINADGNDDQLEGYESWFSFLIDESGCTDDTA